MRGRGMFSVLSRNKRWKSALQWASWKWKWKSGGRWALWSFSPQLHRGEKVFITPLFKTDKRKKQKRKNTQVPFFFLRATDFFVKTYISSSLHPSNQSVLIKNSVWLVEYSSGFSDILLNCAFVQLRQYAVAALSCGGVEDKYERRQVSLNFHQHSGWVAHLNKTKSQESKVCSFPSKSVFIVRWVLLRPTLNQNKLKNNVNMDSLKSALMSCLSMRRVSPVLKKFFGLPVGKRRLRRTCKTW